MEHLQHTCSSKLKSFEPSKCIPNLLNNITDPYPAIRNGNENLGKLQQSTVNALAEVGNIQRAVLDVGLEIRLAS